MYPKYANHKVSMWGLALSVSDDNTFQIETQLVIPWAYQVSIWLQMIWKWIFLFEDYPLL